MNSFSAGLLRHSPTPDEGVDSRPITPDNVIPAEAGIQENVRSLHFWIPAFEGVAK